MRNAYPFEAMLEMWRLPMQAGCDMVNANMRLWSAWLPQGASVGDINIYLPFGNGFRMNIEPNTNWGIVDESRTDVPDLEKDVLKNVASYGRQIGRMMDLLADIAPRVEGVDPECMKDFMELKQRIDALKVKYGREIAA